MNGRESGSIKRGEAAVNVESIALIGRGSACFGDCEIRKYKYSDATNIAQDAGGGAAEKLKPNDKQAAAIKKKIDGLTQVTSSGCPAAGCICVEAAKQPQGYPKSAKPRTKKLTIADPDGGGQISFDVTRTFDIYPGYCDEDDFV